MIEEVEDLIVTIGLAVALNPLIEPNELLKHTLMLVLVRLKTVKLKALIAQWLMTGKPYDHYRTFTEALASDLSTSCAYPIGKGSN